MIAYSIKSVNESVHICFLCSVIGIFYVAVIVLKNVYIVFELNIRYTTIKQSKLGEIHMNIRKASVQDISRIAEILIVTKRITYRPIFKNDIVSFKEMQVVTLANEIMENITILDTIWVYDDNIVKGILHVEDREIKELYVESFFQKEGIGSLFVQFAIQELHSNIVWVLEKNVHAINFYLKHGFMKTSERVLEKGTTEYCIKLRLDKQ